MSVQELINNKIKYLDSLLRTTEYQLVDSRELTANQYFKLPYKRYMILKARSKLLKELTFINSTK